MNKKTGIKYISGGLLALGLLSLNCMTLASCSKKNAEVEIEDDNIVSIEEGSEIHKWYYFSDGGVNLVDLPQNAPQVLSRPWTEAIRISSIASMPASQSSLNQCYAVVNRLGVVTFNDSDIKLSKDVSIFSTDSQETLVFNEGSPIFYRYRSTFFGSDNDSSISEFGMRPFLVQYKPDSGMCFPLVNYQDLEIRDNEEVTDFYWDGKAWAFSVKKIEGEHVEFRYFFWEPPVNVVDYSPALNTDRLLFRPSDEDRYKELNTPMMFDEAPFELKKLVSSIPSNYTLFIRWRDDSGTSPVSYYQQGDTDVPINGFAADFALSGYSAAIFADGTTYLYVKEQDRTVAFRLPKLPAGFSYGEGAMTKDKLYVSWEENNFYKTGRSGFIEVNISECLNLLQ